jgi:hypothetical protein
MKKVLWVKFGWSDYYRGGPVDGNFSWLIKNKDAKNGGRGHEAFNFNPSSNGTYHCYVPPQGKGFAPSNDDSTGWTVVCLARNPKYKGIHVVGWYEDATLHGEWRDPPADLIEKRGDAAHPAYDWSYCITSKTAHFVPPEFRTTPFSDPSIRQGKYSFLEGPGVKINDTKRRVMALLERRLEELKSVAVENPSEGNLPDPEIDSVDPLAAFGTPEHRKAVEQAAEKAVIAHFQNDGFACERVTHLPCGHDFVFSKGETTFHVEVKGTASTAPQFFLTRNEHTKGMKSNPDWRLAMVTEALVAPKIVIHDAEGVAKCFELEPYVYLGKLIPEAES